MIMRQRVGVILGITGIVLLLKPNFDPEQMVMQFNYLLSNYWPILLIFLGMALIAPGHKKKKGTR